MPNIYEMSCGRTKHFVLTPILDIGTGNINTPLLQLSLIEN